MALIGFIYAAYITVVITILIGIFVEGRKAQLDNVLSNMSSFGILLATTDMSLPLIIALSIYLGLGVFIVYRKLRDLYLLFGAKTYGSISLVILFADGGLFGISFADLRTVLTGILVVAGTVHIIGFAYRHRQGFDRRSGGGSGRKKKAKTSARNLLARRRRSRR